MLPASSIALSYAARVAAVHAPVLARSACRAHTGMPSIGAEEITGQHARAAATCSLPFGITIQREKRWEMTGVANVARCESTVAQMRRLLEGQEGLQWHRETLRLMRLQRA